MTSREPKSITALAAGLAIFLMLFSGQYLSYHEIETTEALAVAATQLRHQEIAESSTHVLPDHLHSEPGNLQHHHHPNHNHETPYPGLSAEQSFPLLLGAYSADRQCRRIKHRRYGIDRPPSSVVTA